MHRRPIIAIALTAASLCARAQWIDHNTGQVAPDTKSRKSSATTGAYLVLTGDARSFINEWTNTPESHAPSLPRLGQIRHGDSVWLLLFFTGCGTDKAGCDATVDFTILKPDGSVYGELPGNKVST